MTVFPSVSEARRHEMFADVSGPTRMLLDTDTHNEIDDQWALAWAALSPERIELVAVVAEPYGHVHYRPKLEAAARDIEDGAAETSSHFHNWARHLLSQGIHPADAPLIGPAEGMEWSYEEIVRVLDKMDLPTDGLVFRGADSYMAAPDVPIESEGAERIIELALADDERPLHVAAIGCVTNVSSALLMAPEIATRMVVSWTSGFPSWTDFSNFPSLNLAQDPHASRLLFDSGVPLVYHPGYHIGAQLSFSRPEVDAWIAGKGEIGDYLAYLYDNNPIHLARGTKPFAGQSWIVWDLINIAWLIDRRWVPTRTAPTPRLDEDLVWQARSDPPTMLEAFDINRDAIFHDLIQKLDRQDQILPGVRAQLQSLTGAAHSR